ncbi:MAG: hypothetical protein JSV64_04595 [Candidatus Bathyarchaeota archaeon]|nr:MAG: hypothetical protein JSV64_04595 [Candidatus Bathyarchaeota archaeon]
MKEDERGKFYIIGISQQSIFLRVHQVGKDIIESLDGFTSVAEISDDLRKRNVDVDLQRFISDLGNEGFIENYPFPQSKKKGDGKLRVWYMPFLKNPEKTLNLFHRFLLHFNKRILLNLFLLFNILAVIFFVASVFLGFLHLQFFSLEESSFLAFMIYMLLIFPLLGLAHELAHAVICFHYGGKPNEIGIAVYLFTFFFYAETSDIWLFDKKKSILVFLAGPLATLFIGNVSFLIYISLQTSAWSQLFLMVAFASYLSVLSGLNPLIEADGCYILQALVVFPNIHSHLWSYASSWLKRSFGLSSEKEFEDFTSTYSKAERKTLRIYTPLALLMNGMMLAIIIPWSISLIQEFARLTLDLTTTFPNLEASVTALWIFQGAYLSLVFAFSLLRITKYAVGRLTRMRMKRSERVESSTPTERKQRLPKKKIIQICQSRSKSPSSKSRIKIPPFRDCIMCNHALPKEKSRAMRSFHLSQFEPSLQHLSDP